MKADSDFVSHATVTLQRKQTLTDSSGNFEFDHLQPGRYLLTVSLVGFESFSQPVQIGSEVQHLNIQLQPATASMDAIVVSGTMKAVHKLESPVAVEVYTPQFFKKKSFSQHI